MLDNIPLELRHLHQWVAVDMAISPETGKPKKHPLHPRTGALASVIDPATWGTFEEARMTGGVIGIVLTEHDPYTIIDLDNKPEKPLTEEQWQRHQKILTAFDSYTERSVSGRGYHIIVKGNIPAGVHRDNVEVYSTSRYMICTGDVVRNTPIVEYQQLLDILYGEMKPDDLAPLVDRDALLSDEDLVAMAMRAANADKFNSLCSGDMTDYPSQSEADFALLSIIAYYTQDNEQVRRVFRYSALGKREKAIRNDVYLDRALGKIRGKQAPEIDPAELIANAERIVAPVQQSQAMPAPLDQLTLPRGLVGELAVYFYQTAVRPVPEIALAGAIAFMAGICARSYNISGSGLNQYLILLARTGSGKEGALAGMENIIAAVRQQIPLADQFLGPAAFASGQALVKVLNERPCFVSVLGEFGLTLQELSDHRANSAQKMLKKVLLDLYAKSGWNRHLRSSVYSDTEKNTKIVQAPNVSIMGESTPETFFDGLDISHIAEGLIPRFSVMEYKGERPRRNRNANMPPDPSLVAKMASLITTSLTMTSNNTCAPVQTDSAALHLLDAFDSEADDIMNGASAEVEMQLWNRAHLKALKMAALLAVGVNPQQPVVTQDLAEWAIAFVRQDVSIVIKRFQKGDVGVGDSKQFNDLQRVISTYYTSSFSTVEKYGGTKALHDNKLVPYCYLIRKTAGIASFKNDRLGATLALKKNLLAMVESGLLVEVSKTTAMDKYKFSGVLYGVTASFSVSSC